MTATVVSIDVNQKDVDAFIARTSEARLYGMLVPAFKASLSYLLGEIKQSMPVDLGLARAATTVKGPVTTRASIEGSVVNPMGYVAVLEYGRTPGASPPPVSAILPWVLRHGMPPEAAYPVAISIGKRGTPPHRMFQNAAEKGGPVVTSIIVRSLKDL